MANNKRRKKGRLADMTITPPAEPVFGLPPPDECEEVESRCGLVDNQEIQVRYLRWTNGLIVEFAIMQFTRVEGKWYQVARIDSCHAGIVHQHQLKHGSDDDQGNVRVLGQIPADGWDLVDKWYDKALTLMETEWHENLRKWGGSDD